MGDAINNEFDRWVEGSPNVVGDDLRAFSEALATGQAHTDARQSQAASFQIDGEGDIATYGVSE